jgi:glycosyltransferase involved in cell wall biosynthesis
MEPVAGPKICAVIPVLNEEGAIGPMLRRLPAIIDAAIVVDGGSRDATVAEAREAGAIVLIEPRRGYGRACQTGAEHADHLGAALVVFMDGDGADAVELSAKLVEPVLQDTADFVLADRTSGKRDPGSMGAHQVFAGHAVGAAVGLITGHRYRDMCAFRAIRIADLKRLGMREMGYGWNLEMQIRAVRAGLRVREIPMPYHNRIAGESKVAGSLKGTLRAGQRIIRTLISVGLATRRSAS